MASLEYTIINVFAILKVATQFYNQTLEIHLVSEEMDADSTHVVFDLLFDNRAFFEV